MRTRWKVLIGVLVWPLGIYWLLTSRSIGRAPKIAIASVTGLILVLIIVAAATSGGGGSNNAASSNTPTNGSTTTAAESADCGKTIDVPPGSKYDGGGVGGKLYSDVVGKPIVSNAGDGTSCVQLRALAEAYDTLSGPKLFGWLDKHGWTWMNYDEKAEGYMLFDPDSNDVFIGTHPGQRSQVSFATA